MLDPEQFRPLVKEVARSVSSNFPPYVTQEDTEQALYVWLYEKKTSIANLVENDPASWRVKIASTMRKVAFSYCAREKAASEGYSMDDVFKYSIPRLQRLMPDVFDYSDWQSFGQYGDGQPKSKAQANETGDRLAELVDIKAAIKRLNPDTKAVLYLQWREHYTGEMVAEHYGISVDAARKRMSRALKALQKELGYKPPATARRAPDRRTVITNEAARAALSNAYEG